MACLLYCVTLASGDLIPNLIGAAEQPVVAHDSDNLRIYWSGVANPEALFGGTSRKSAELRYEHVLREIVIRTTAIAFPFPALITDPESIDAAVAGQREHNVEALTRLAGTIQYQLTATWADDDRADLAIPVTGKEFQKRRAESEARIAAIDTKLKAVAAGVVREWRSRQVRRRHLWFALMACEDRDQFIAALRSAGPSEGVRLRLSGPSPPNDFVRAQQ